MENRPVYKNTFSRDFTLATIQVWYRAEAIDDKIWTEKKQPFMPFIVSERTKDTVNGFYDGRGIDWVRKSLFKKIKANDGFLSFLENNFKKNYDICREIYEKKQSLSLSELKNFFDQYEKAWVWFEATWWLWDTKEENLGDVKLDKSLISLRESTQDFVPKSEVLIRKSLKNLYPQVGDFIDCLTVEEIIDKKVPPAEELKKRRKGYIFTDNKLFVGVSRKEIEDKYEIIFEDLTLSNDLKEINGVSAFSGNVMGKVKIVLSLKQLSKIEEGDILVSTMTMPDFLPAIKKASAIITDEGGLLCHASIISRELKKPCIIGTKIATKVLKDGDLVEVDADKGLVKIIKN
jgi:phosphohistidine swiveling domain-containing protein